MRFDKNEVTSLSKRVIMVGTGRLLVMTSVVAVPIVVSSLRGLSMDWLATNAKEV